MRRSLMMVFLVAGLLAPAHVFAQDGAEGAGEGEPAEAGEPAATEPATTEGEPAAEVDEPAEDASVEGDAPAEGDAPGEGEPTAEEDTGPKIGPGGRELRADYPGTEEAMKESMETDKLQGVASDDGAGGQAYDLRVKELETRIDDLKDKVFRSKSRIVLLKETLLGNKLGGSGAIVSLQNNMGNRFELVRLAFVIDGKSTERRANRDGSLSGKESIEFYNGAMGPGPHELLVQLEYKGKSSVFSYFNNYTFTLQQRCKFSVDEGMQTTVDLVAFQGGNITTPVDERPEIRCDVAKAPAVAEKVAPAARKGVE